HYNLSFFLLKHPPTTHIYTLSLHDALPIWDSQETRAKRGQKAGRSKEPQARKEEEGARTTRGRFRAPAGHQLCQSRARSHRDARSEEHTSELQSLTNLVCRLLLEKKKKRNA